MFRQGLLRTRPPVLAAKSFRVHRPLICASIALSLRPQGSLCVAAQSRFLSTSSSLRNEQQKPLESPVQAQEKSPYIGPLAQTFRRLKIFSISSFTLSCTLAPFMFIVESNLPMSARIALASIAIGTSGISTGLVGWCGQPYVTTLRHLTPEENGGAEGIELTTLTLLLRPRITRVYDPTFLLETKRAFAKWELADTVVLPNDKTVEPGQEETVAETTDKDGNVLGRWVVKWGEGGEGTCHEVGKIISLAAVSHLPLASASDVHNNSTQSFTVHAAPNPDNPFEGLSIDPKFGFAFGRSVAVVDRGVGSELSTEVDKRAVTAVLRVAVKLITKIVKLVKAKIEKDKLARGQFTKHVVEEGRRNRPEFNWVACHPKHRTKWAGERNKDWGHEHKEFAVSFKKTVGYEIYYGREGEIWNEGDGGYLNWAYSGFFKTAGKKNKHVTFKRPPGT
ncbi:hypothetical protein DXG03_001439 [Asterophora parasitica]|uniref:Uncharacterized protein n=1 Tax=Asterophora parasitica TaxID=117018 RepID=A0A9P7KF29_9AGAR|nr:hypothetical protein DXG03_001439 [Asterophora parasitica]